MLRPRFRPGWKPSWLGTKKGWYECEDALLSLSVDALDATRISDEKLVMLKRILTSLHPYEVEIGRLFSEEPFASEPRNHCVPIFETLQDPFDADYQIIVMPFLRGYDKPQFQTIGELAEFWRQAFEGLHFMHEHRVAHRDCMILNIMMDPQPLFPDMYHPLRPNQSRDLRGTPKHYSRTVRPTRYYYIDFGLSRRYPADDVSPREPPIIGGDKTVPEFQGNLRFQPSDPFPTDVYCIGNLIRERYLQEFKGVEFMEKLIEDMTQSDPAKRPTMTEVITRYDQLLDGLNRRKLRERLVHREENAVARLYKDVKHTIITAGYVMRQLPPLPRPPT
ncbi:hypothetical protein CERSUDRAFT_107977 [Gelatoporia subvermispora B]|uniref:Protein kinase domain-containing protein n=1 Tax=Ceriporiopsis subvermispora (strain B) TaxID=914234 RepID=M2QNB2_CERS8|nr:hypothetical protein CERSUDRAFT_107977 [Gelatoporia subvermispora B]